MEDGERFLSVAEIKEVTEKFVSNLVPFDEKTRSRVINDFMEKINLKAKGEKRNVPLDG